MNRPVNPDLQFLPVQSEHRADSIHRSLDLRFRHNANQANAHLSTGPKSAQGKAKSSANSTKEGFNGKTAVIAPGEEEDFAAGHLTKAELDEMMDICSSSTATAA